MADAVADGLDDPIFTWYRSRRCIPEIMPGHLHRTTVLGPKPATPSETLVLSADKPKSRAHREQSASSPVSPIHHDGGRRWTLKVIPRLPSTGHGVAAPHLTVALKERGRRTDHRALPDLGVTISQGHPNSILSANRCCACRTSTLCKDNVNRTLTSALSSALIRTFPQGISKTDPQHSRPFPIGHSAAIAKKRRA